MRIEEVLKLGNAYEICDFAESNETACTPENMKKLEDAIIKIGDIVHIYEFMFLMVDSGIKEFNLKRFEEIIRNSKNAKLMCYCVGFVPGIDTEAMLNALYETKNVKYIERLSDEEYGLDINSLPGYHQKLEEAKLYDYFPECLNQFGTTDINELREKAIESKDPYLINEVADYLEYLEEYKGFKGIDIAPLQEAQLEYADPLNLYEFAASVKGSDKQAFQNQVVKSGMAKYMYYMYEYVEGVNKKELAEAIKVAGNEKYIEKIIRAEISELKEKEEILLGLEKEKEVISKAEKLIAEYTLEGK